MNFGRCWRFWNGICHFILIWIWSLVFGTAMIWMLALYLDFECEKTSMFFESWLWTLEDAGGSWIGFVILILICILSLVFGTAMIWMLALYLDFEGAKTIHVLKSPDFGLWKRLEALDWGLASESWFGYGHWGLVHPWPEFWLYLDFEGAKNIHVL